MRGTLRVTANNRILSSKASTGGLVSMQEFMPPSNESMKILVGTMFSPQSKNNLESLIDVKALCIKKKFIQVPKEEQQQKYAMNFPLNSSDSCSTTPHENPLLFIDGYQSFADNFLSTANFKTQPVVASPQQEKRKKLQST